MLRAERFPAVVPHLTRVAVEVAAHHPSLLTARAREVRLHLRLNIVREVLGEVKKPTGAGEEVVAEGGLARPDANAHERTVALFERLIARLDDAALLLPGRVQGAQKSRPSSPCHADEEDRVRSTSLEIRCPQA